MTSDAVVVNDVT